MGEYAEYRGRQIKIGTCEDMLYLRADQAHLVRALAPRNVDPVKDAGKIRFRFPWPDEDRTEPGMFDDHDRSLAIDDVTAPAGVDHHPVQFRAGAGYLVSLPCPEQGDAGLVSLASDGSDHPYRVNRNAFAGSVALIQQRWYGGLLAAVCKCPCGARWRLPELSDAQPVIDALHSMANRDVRRRDEASAVFRRAVADRVAAGYALKQEAATA